MPANHCIPHTEETKRKIALAKIGRPALWRRREIKIVDGIDLFRCGSCGAFLPRIAFYKENRTILGIKGQCKRCHLQTAIGSRDIILYRRTKILSEAKRRANKKDGHIQSAELTKLDSLFGKKCLCCGSVDKLEWDHIMPLSCGGEHSLENLQRLCGKCNWRKHTRNIDYRSEDQKRWVISFKVLERA